MTNTRRVLLAKLLSLLVSGCALDEAADGVTERPSQAVASDPGKAPNTAAERGSSAPSSNGPATRAAAMRGSAGTMALGNAGRPANAAGAMAAGNALAGAAAVGGAAAAGGAPAATAGTGGSVSDGAAEVGEDRGASCASALLPAADQLSSVAKHPDPFLMLDGSRITRKAQWRCRRAQIKAQLERYESGPKPAVARENVSAQLSGDSLAITVKDGSKSIRFSVTIKPASSAAAQPVPALIAFGIESLDRSVFSQNGVATIVFGIDAMGAQSGAGSRGQGTFFELYGADHEASSMVAWAWGVSRIIDALELTPSANIDPKRIAVTGCSRNGKGALLAGALDERIVLTIPQESGAGGSASWRVSQSQSAMGEHVQTLASAASEQPWFRADFGKSFGQDVTKLPFDHHMVMGLVAPRALLVLDNKIDWLGIDSTFTAGSIAHEIWDALGVPDRMGYWQTSAHQHCQFPAEQREVLDAYVKKFLVGTGSSDTKLLRAAEARAELDQWKEWTTPDLQ